MEEIKLNIKKVAEVARLNLVDKEIERFSDDLKNILDAFKELEKAKIDGVSPTFQPIDSKDILREDVVEPSFGQKLSLSQIKNNKEEGHFKGPKAV